MIKKIHFQNEVVSTERQNPSSLNSHPSSFEWAPSVQSDLFEYLKPHQKAALKPYLRLIKRDYQEKLCISLLDYLEGHGLDTFNEPVLCKLQEEIVEVCHLHPLTSREPKSIGTLIQQFFGSLKNSQIL